MIIWWQYCVYAKSLRRELRIERKGGGREREREEDISYLADCDTTPDLFDACYFNNTNAINNSAVIADRGVQP